MAIYRGNDAGKDVKEELKIVSEASVHKAFSDHNDKKKELIKKTLAILIKEIGETEDVNPGSDQGEKIDFEDLELTVVARVKMEDTNVIA